ncbi:MAG: PAS domain S-box protein [Planctomycetes bacterium]|nr:PAS domain S-box protein [Planctomycetota bacterium]
MPGSSDGHARVVPVTGVPPGRRSRLVSWRLWGGVFGLVVAATAAYGAFILAPNERADATAAWNRRLVEISADRANAVSELLRERAEDAAVIAGFPSMGSVLAGAAATPRAGGDLAGHIDQVLESFATTHEFTAIWVFDAANETIVRWPRTAASAGRMADIARTARARIGTPTSVLVESEGAAQVLIARATDAVTVVLVSDAAAIFGRIASTGADEVERLVVAIDGDRLLRIELCRHDADGAPLNIGSSTVEAAHPDLRVATAGRADPGPTDSAAGGAAHPATLVASHVVKGTTWAAVARVDRGAVYASVDADTRSQLLLLGAWLFAIGGLGFGLIRAQRAAHDEALLRSEAKLSKLIERANDPMLVLRTDGTIERASDRAGEFYRMPAASLVGRTILDLRPAEDHAEARDRLARSATAAGDIFEAVHVRSDGSRVPVEVSARCIDFEGEARILASIRDITRRRRAEARVAAVARFLRTLVAVNDHILAEQDPDSLLGKACATIAERSGASAVWIGDVDARDGSVQVRAVAGVSREDLKRTIDAIHVTGRQPASAVARDGECVGVSDTSDASAGDPSLAVLASAGVRSLAIAPIRRGGALVGVLQLHGAVPAMFEGESLYVVAEIAAALGLALTAIDDRRARDDERAQAETAIRASAAREHERAVELAAVLDAVPVGVWFAEDAAATRIRGNRQAEVMLGFPHGTVLSAPELTADVPSNPVRASGGRPLTYDEMPMVVAARECRRLDGLNLEFVRPDGVVVEIHGSAAPILDASGVPRGSVGSFMDVTELRKTDARLRVLSRLVEQNTASVVITDRRGVIEYVNRKFEELTGYSLDEARGQTPRVLRSGEMPPDVYAQLWATILGGKEWRGELHNRKKDGTLYWEYAVIMPIVDDAGRIAHFAAVKEDITLRKEAERALASAQRELAQAQRMEAIGRLAGGIAHDFNNILGVILGYAELSIARVAAGDPMRRNLQEICDAADRAANLTRQLLAFSRRQTAEAGVIDICAATRDVTKMLRRLIGEDVVVNLRIDDAACHVCADAGQIEQLVLNLAVNARDAMPEGGTLTVSTEAVEVRPPGRASEGAGPVPDDGLPPGRYALLSVADTGTGLSPEAREHLFEPFFTTKEPGKGTGLGLATLWGIVAQRNGHVRYTTESGRGTTFRIYLPQVDEPVVSSAPAAAPESRRGRGESVLVVEDDPAVRSLVERLVAAAGYRVVAVSGIDEAMAAVDAVGAKFDVVLSDVVMPKSGGPEIVRALRARDPALRALFMSGYTERVSADKGALPPGAAFLQKPFTVAKLEQKIREVMDAPPPGA